MSAKPLKILYIGLENQWPESVQIERFTDGMECTQNGNNVYIYRHVHPGIHLTSLEYDLFLIKYIRIAGNLGKKELLPKYPFLSEWINSSWPVPVGRYRFDADLNLVGEKASDVLVTYVIDVVFGEADSSLQSYFNSQTGLPLPVTPYDSKWSTDYKSEIVSGNYGYWPYWSYDLKTSAVADITMHLLEKIPPKDREPHKIVRFFTAMCNEKNESSERGKGLIFGMWGRDHPKDGKDPTYWKSTQQVANVRIQTGKPVKYGQCWVFAEVLTSLFRYLGIPSRTVYAKNVRIDRGSDGGLDIDIAKSKGDEDLSEEFKFDVWDAFSEIVYKGDTVCLEIENDNEPTQETEEQFLAEDVIQSEATTKGDGNESTTKNEEKYSLQVPTSSCIKEVDPDHCVTKDDSLWNFHLWTETFIQRPDLEGTYKTQSWNCCDPSPSIQSSSNDLFKDCYVLGPCPVKAIQGGGELYKTLPDHDFIFLNTSVNGVYRFWKSAQVIAANGVIYNISYCSLIVYNSLTRENTVQRGVEVYTRDTNKSYGTVHIVKEEITNSYLHDSSIALRIHHRYHPILFDWEPTVWLGGVNRPTFTVQTPIEADTVYYVQVCYLKVKELISYYRTSVSDWKDLIIPIAPKEATRLSIFIANTRTSKWWVQVI